EVYRIDDHKDWILSLEISNDGNFLASGDRAGVLGLWDAATGEGHHLVAAHEDGLPALAFRPDAKSLATVGGDGRLKIWDLDEGKPSRTNNAHQGPVFALAWSAELGLATSGRDGVIKLHRADGRPAGQLAKTGDWVYSLQFDSEAKILFVGPWDGRVRAFDLQTKKEIPRGLPEG
ncbi:MAG: hypothetical protein KDB53_17465, partial [Planctomycetes bacterium]|nr:hypothetical protein [Planctomycetota bacterium]